MTDLIDTTEMYLRTILELEEEGQPPMRARISERLHHSGPTVSQTVSRMERDGLLTVEGDRWYGRGTADNKGQHTASFSALRHVIEARGGRLGYNVTVLLEMGEEAGSPQQEPGGCGPLLVGVDLGVGQS